MTFHDALVALLAICGAGCGLVSVAAAIEQRGKADRAAAYLDGEIIIDGGPLGDPEPGAPPEPDNGLGAVLRRIIDVARPGWVPIWFGIAGVLFSGAAGVLAFYPG